MFSFLLRAASLMLLALGAEAEVGCDEEGNSCLAFVINGHESVLSEGMCNIYAPRLDNLYSAFSIVNLKFFCGPYLDDVTGLVVTNLGPGGGVGPGWYVYPSTTVAECAGTILAESFVADEFFYDDAHSPNELLYDCVTSCPYLAAAPLAKVDDASTPSTEPLDGIPDKFTKMGTKYIGYIPMLPNSFGATQGLVDVVAAKVPLMTTMRISDDPGDCFHLPFNTLEAASASLTAGVFLFPGFFFDGQKEKLLNKFLSNDKWYKKSLATMADLYFFKDDKSVDWMVDKIFKMRNVDDFAMLGPKYKEGHLGFMYGVLDDASSYAAGTQTLTAKFNFKVASFQEAFAYLFFSPVLDSELSDLLPADAKRFFALALNMLVRHLASPETLCEVKFDGIKAGCGVEAAVFPTRYKKSYMRSVADLREGKDWFNQAVPLAGGGFTVPGSGVVQRSAPAEGGIYQAEVDISPGADATAKELVLGGNMGPGQYSLGNAPPVDVPVLVCDRPVETSVTEFQKVEEGPQKFQIPNYIQPSINAFPTGAGRITANAVREGRRLGIDPFSTLLGVSCDGQRRNLADVANFALPSLRSSTASAALTREDGILARRGRAMAMAVGSYPRISSGNAIGRISSKNAISRQDFKQISNEPDCDFPNDRFKDCASIDIETGHSKIASIDAPDQCVAISCGKCYREKGLCVGGSPSSPSSPSLGDSLGSYTSCRAPDSAHSVNTCASGLVDLQNEGSTVPQVKKFYENEPLVMKGCKGAVVFPSECGVDIFSKDVSFLFGGLTNAGVTDIGYGFPKTSSYVKKGFPAASRLDRMMNFVTELFAVA